MTYKEFSTQLSELIEEFLKSNDLKKVSVEASMWNCTQPSITTTIE